MTSTRAAAAELVAASRDGRLDELCEAHRVRLLGLFGSAANPAAVDPDDVDVAVGFLGPARLVPLDRGPHRPPRWLQPTASTWR